MEFYASLPAGSGAERESATPTLFEILSADETDELLTPSLRYIVATLVARHPSRFGILASNWFDEWFVLATRLCIEGYHLRRWNGGFIEHFYGLKRVNGSNRLLLKAAPSDRSVRLTGGQSVAALVEKVVAPYWGVKLDLWHGQLLARSAFADRVSAWQRWFVKWYPRVKKVVFLANLAVKLAFLSGAVGSTSLLQYLFKIEFARLSQKDLETTTTVRAASRASRRPHLNRPALKTWLSVAVARFANVSQQLGSQAFPAFIFMLRVFQWWNAQDLSNRIRKKMDEFDNPVPPPPRDLSIRTGTMCSICEKPLQNPAVIETGLVFCYPCLLRRIPETGGRCPTTGKRLLNCRYNETTGAWVLSGVRKLIY
ncbi:LAMI_0C10902g1_1 [Lachancea mirantina]|uniref:Peroxisome assembly protein 12 n=1 Tax=Lachancea mirantina TaxID=1230905 RepID=A0A1G4J6F2_9SACH|nr:LAMI_0C10902g1_1 [Lachancea mirantina]